MINFKCTDEQLSTTKDCVDYLNDNFYVNNWKRSHKFKIKENIVRVFNSDDGKSISIVDCHYDTQYTKVFECDLYYCKQLSIDLDNVCKKYYSHDYTDVYYNPSDNSLYVTAGDGGYCYSTLSKSDVKSLFSDGDDFYSEPNSFNPDSFSYKEINDHDETKIISYVEWEAECDPDDDSGYFKISSINDICDFEY